MNLSEELKPGLKGSTEILVGTRDTAPHVGSGKIKVLATPVMVNLMEEAALNAVEGLLPEGHQTVGTRLDISHVAATPVGMRVRAHAELVRVDDRKLTFRVFAERGAEEKIWGSMVKQALKRRQPGFNEAYYGFRSFGKLLDEAEARKLLTLEPDEKSGGVIIKSYNPDY